MGLETGTFVADLVTSNPPTSDLETQGANHLQLIKTVLQNTFGTSVRRLVGLPSAIVLSGNTTLTTAAHTNMTIFLNTAGGPFTVTLPTLAGSDAGWECSFAKSSVDANPVFIAPPSGTLVSGEYFGLSKARRCIPGRRSRCVWSGSTFFLDRIHSHPVGSVLPYPVSKTLPPGYEWPNGQTLSSAANYPEYFGIFGVGTTIDMRGRSFFGQDDMGGAAANRITVAGGNFDGTVLNNTGGLQNHTLLTAELPVHSHPITDVSHVHSMGITPQHQFTVQTGEIVAQSGAANTGSSFTGITTTNNAGSGSAHSVLSPGMTSPFLLIVE